MNDLVKAQLPILNEDISDRENRRTEDGEEYRPE
jgi:hypothetical protein